MYSHGKKRKSIWRRARPWLFLALIIFLLSWAGISHLRKSLKPTTTISKSTATQATVNYDTQTAHYSEADFTIDLPKSWTPVPRPAGPYNSYTWKTSANGSDGEVIEVFEDTIPSHFAVNRVLIVRGEVDHLTVEGNASDNCSQYTNGATVTAGQVGTPAKWQGVNFLCDEANQQRDVLGTSSLDGINTVLLKNQSNGTTHKFFFTYTDYKINPDYSVFYNVLSSLKMN
jgi:hypothetical protein